MATSFCRLLAASALALSCAAPPKSHRGDALPGASEAPQVTGSSAGGDDGFLQPNAKDSDGTPMYVHYTAEDMPLRVDVQLPKLAARLASREQTDEAVIEAIRSWEAAIQPVVPWFKLEIVRGQRDAAIEVEWKTRISGDASGWGGLGWSTAGGRMLVRGRLEYATKPCLAMECQLDLAQLKLVVTHEFGHTLGLMHCLDCDSAMNYSWETRERVLITEVDVRTIRALYALPNGTRVDGTLARSLRPAPR
jgi:predicted Zn-dependent protease